MPSGLARVMTWSFWTSGGFLERSLAVAGTPSSAGEAGVFLAAGADVLAALAVAVAVVAGSDIAAEIVCSLYSVAGSVDTESMSRVEQGS